MKGALMRFPLSSVLLVSLLAGGLAAQEPSGDRVAVPLSDPARPATVRANLLSGSISVKGYDGREVIVEARPRAEAARRRQRDQGERTEGLRRLQIGGTGLT